MKFVEAVVPESVKTSSYSKLVSEFYASGLKSAEIFADEEGEIIKRGSLANAIAKDPATKGKIRVREVIEDGGQVGKIFLVRK